MKDYYKILGLETTKVTINEVRTAYRAVAKKYHPDVNIGDKLAEERIKDINEAYRVLSNVQAKRKYDRIWNASNKRRAFSEKNRQPKAFINDFLYMFLGNIESEKDTNNEKILPIKGENVETSIKIDVTQAFFGVNKKISLKTEDGKTKTINVKIPDGIHSGERIRIVGQGRQGQNGGKNGDLLIKVLFSKKGRFTVEGCNLHTELLITPWEAALGTRAIVNTIDGESTVYIPQGIQTGEVIKIPEKGYKKKQGGRGDLIAKVKVVVPKQLTEEEKNIFEKLNKISTFNPRNSY